MHQDRAWPYRPRQAAVGMMLRCEGSDWGGAT